MFIKYTAEAFDNLHLQGHINTFSYTQLDNEPSFLHSHSLSELIFPLTNYCRLVTSKEIIPMHKGVLYIVNPHIMHTETKLAKYSDSQYYALKINGALSKEEKQAPINVIPCEKAQGELESYLHFAKQHFEMENKQLASLNLYCFFLRILDVLNNENYILVKEKNAQASSIVSEIKHYLANNYGNALKIDDICKQFDISQSSLTRMFNKEEGVAPKEYLTRQRLNSAKYLLKTSDFPITQISTMCGFNSPAYFTYTFKSAFHVSPREYRLRYLNDPQSDLD